MALKVKKKKASVTPPEELAELVASQITGKESALQSDPERFDKLFLPIPVKNFRDCQAATLRLNNIKDALESFELEGYFESDGMFFADAEMAELNDRLNEQTYLLSKFKDSVPDYDIKILERNLNYLLEQNDADKNTLSDLLGISHSYLPRVLNPTDEKRRMSVEMLYKIAGYFDITLDRLVRYDLREAEISSVNKAARFLLELQEATLKHTIQWERLDPVENPDDSYFLNAILLAKGCFESEEEAWDGTWVAQTKNGKIYLSREGSDKYLLAASGETVQKLFSVKMEEGNELSDRFEKLEDAIANHRDEFYLTDEASDFMDNFLSGFGRS